MDIIGFLKKIKKFLVDPPWSWPPGRRPPTPLVSKHLLQAKLVSTY